MQSFYDPVNDNLIEPELAGISYSFTSDGYYEEAYYRAISNRTSTPVSCLTPHNFLLYDYFKETRPAQGIY